MKEIEQAYADLFEAAGLGRPQCEGLASAAGQTQTRWQAMWTISAAPLTVPQVARRLGITRQSVQRTVDELRRDGRLELVANPDHRTSPLLRLNESGQDRLIAINAAANNHHHRMLDHISTDEIQTLRTLLGKLSHAIRATDPTT